MEIIAKKGKSPEMRIADFLSRVNVKGSCTNRESESGLVVALQDSGEGQRKQFLDVEELKHHQDNCATLKIIKEAVKMVWN